jgi:hypothetical protein
LGDIFQKTMRPTPKISPNRRNFAQSDHTAWLVRLGGGPGMVIAGSGWARASYFELGLLRAWNLTKKVRLRLVLFLLNKLKSLLWPLFRKSPCPTHLA